MRPRNAATDDRAKELLAAAKLGFEQIAAGNPELLLQKLVPDANANEERGFWSGWIKEAQERRGKFVSATPLWVVPSGDQLHAYVVMRFENSSTIVRWEQRPAGSFAHAFPPRQVPDLYRFVPQSATELVTWNPILGASATLRIEGNDVVIGGARARRQAVSR